MISLRIKENKLPFTVFDLNLNKTWEELICTSNLLVQQKHQQEHNGQNDPLQNRMKMAKHTYITWVVDESGSISFHSGVHYEIIIYSEHITADTLPLVILLTFITQLVSDYLPWILYYLC